MIESICVYFYFLNSIILLETVLREFVVMQADADFFPSRHYLTVVKIYMYRNSYNLLNLTRLWRYLNMPAMKSF